MVLIMCEALEGKIGRTQWQCLSNEGENNLKDNRQKVSEVSHRCHFRQKALEKSRGQ